MAASHGAKIEVEAKTLAEVKEAVRADADIILLDNMTPDQVRAAVVSAWSQYQAARENVSANRDAVAAAELALSGVIEERKVGQRTTLDVLDSQADVITAQINLVGSERDPGPEDDSRPSAGRHAL